MEFEKTKEAIEKLPEELQEIAKDYLKDIMYWESKVEALQQCQTFQVDPNNPLRQRKLPAHDMLKEAQQQKVNIQRALSVLFKGLLDGEEDDDEFVNFLNKKGNKDEKN